MGVDYEERADERKHGHMVGFVFSDGVGDALTLADN
jgi:hypothetical protein